VASLHQVGIVGNSIKTKSLPEPNSITYADGNRFYTLVEEQEGFVNGHTYRTVLNDDGSYSWLDVDKGSGDFEMGADSDSVVNYLAGNYSGKVIDTEGKISQIYGFSFYNQDLTEISCPNVSIIGSYINYSAKSAIGYAFYGCSNLSRISFPNCSQIVNASTNFQGCVALENAEFPALTSSYVVPSMFNGLSALSIVEMPNVQTVSSFAFRSCKNLKIVKFSPDGLTQVMSSAFYGCKSLESVKFASSGSVRIYASAFEDCYALESVYINGASNAIISDYAFAYCSSLSTVTISAETISLNNSAFAFCTGLNELNIYANSGTITLTSCVCRNCSSLTNLNIYAPEGVYFSGPELFSRCSSLKWGNLSNAKILKIAGAYLFTGCKALDYIYAPECSYIGGAYMFSGCNNLSYAYLAKIKTISGVPFEKCYYLSAVYIMQESGLTEADIPTLTSSLAFSAYYGVGDMTPDDHTWIYVGYEEYIPWLQSATNWVNFVSQIKASQFVPPA
jgi:hypothetical protein